MWNQLQDEISLFLVRALEDYQLIGQVCKHRNMFSWLVLTPEDLTTSYVQCPIKQNTILRFFCWLLLSLQLVYYVVLRVQTLNHTGGYYDEATPVPIPNTEVKLVRADNTWLVTAREDRLLPVYISPLTLKVKGLFYCLIFSRNITILFAWNFFFW